MDDGCWSIVSRIFRIKSDLDDFKELSPSMVISQDIPLILKRSTLIFPNYGKSDFSDVILGF